VNAKFSNERKYEMFLRQIDVPCHKLEAYIWNSYFQFGTWETLNYSFEDKENHEIFCQISLNIIAQNVLQQKVQQEKKIP
jgi:hypothetical protein